MKTFEYYEVIECRGGYDQSLALFSSKKEAELYRKYKDATEAMHRVIKVFDTAKEAVQDDLDQYDKMGAKLKDLGAIK